MGNDQRQPRKLTEGYIKSLVFEGRAFAVRDAAVTGLMLDVNKRCKSYKVQRDLWVGERGRRRLVKTVRKTLGTTEDITLDEARTRALALIAEIKRGKDPNRSWQDMDAGSWTVTRMYEEYAADLRRRECAERTALDVLARLESYLGDWKALPISEIKKSMAREKHTKLSVRRGKRIANMALKDFRWAYNLALRVVDDPDALGDNPTNAITWNKERASNRVLMPDELPEWWVKVQAIDNPVRRAMHELGLLSGLRPGTLVSLRCEWVDLDKRVIHIPKMKSGRSFDLPLSERMIEVVQQALEAGAALYPRTEWLFPTRLRKGEREVKHVQVWRENTLPSQTGHILRHTYRTIAKRAGIDQIDARLLLDHTVPGIDGVYIHSRALFDRLLSTQGVMSTEILALCEPRLDCSAAAQAATHPRSA
ncbi:MAG: tyrosine-type recombinase/integrase [Terricaulis sp.]|nr:tyrosine-type recombinase/integrase [Terricaulis sp.]